MSSLSTKIIIVWINIGRYGANAGVQQVATDVLVLLHASYLHMVDKYDDEA